MTPKEFQNYIEAFNEKERREWRKIAWLGAVILSGLSGKRISARDLKPNVFPQQGLTDEEWEEALNDLKERLGRDRIDGGH